MQRAVIIGATSGIGKELARVLAKNGFAVGLTGRRGEILRKLQQELPTIAYIKQMDVSMPAEATQLLQELIAEMGGMDLIIISAGVGFANRELEWELEKQTIDVNVSGFAAMAGAAFNYFRRQGSGHLVGISSIAAIRGNRGAPAYNASKAFVSNYLEGLRVKASRLGLPITVTDIQPGYVDTPMAKGPGLFWVAPAEKAAMQIYRAIVQKRHHAYITKRWRLIAWMLKVMPGWIYNRQ